ncbi:MAG: hypothetical protein HZA90_01565 [Verrucomicrobia bacterium]|nr:hypothetical protein [Verrucomicrobiota bacterium]
MTVEAAELKLHLTEYLRQAGKTGEAITICEDQRPLAVLTALPAPTQTGNGNLIDRLLASPIPAPHFQPLTRDQIYGRH